MNTINSFVRRRHLLKYVGIGGVSMLISSQVPSHAIAPPAEFYAANPNLVPSDEALKRLIDGNRRFVQQKRIYPDQSQMQLKAVSQTQHPFAAVLSCADSRVPPEIIFDEGIGDIFDIRIPGNIATLEVVGSLEYAVEVLGTRLIMVLGHERCGAVNAAVKGEKLPGHISSFVKFVQPSLAIVKNKSGDPIDNAVVANANYQMKQIKKSSALIERKLTSKALKIVYERYDLDTGEVRILS